MYIFCVSEPSCGCPSFSQCQRTASEVVDANCVGGMDKWNCRSVETALKSKFVVE